MNQPLTSTTNAIALILNFLRDQESWLLARGADVRIEHHRGTGDVLTTIKLIWTPDGPARLNKTDEDREYSFVVSVATQLPVTCHFYGQGMVAHMTRRQALSHLDRTLHLWFDTFIAESRALFQLNFGPTFTEIPSDVLAGLFQRGEQHLRDTVNRRRFSAQSTQAAQPPEFALA